VNDGKRSHSFGYLISEREGGLKMKKSCGRLRSRNQEGWRDGGLLSQEEKQQEDGSRRCLPLPQCSHGGLNRGLIMQGLATYGYFADNFIAASGTFRGSFSIINVDGPLIFAPPNCLQLGRLFVAGSGTSVIHNHFASYYTIISTRCSCPGVVA
jgi:hypothetical protein